MFISGFPAGAFQANCYVLAGEKGGSAVIIDPGEDAAGQIASIVAENELKPVAVLLTHGHLDHTASVVDVCQAYDVPALIHADDEYMLDDPLAALSPELRQALSLRGGVGPLRPAEVQIIGAGPLAVINGLAITVDPTPGHTGGSVVFRVDGEGDRSEVLFTGDTLFAGSVGRTDLPGGSRAVLDESLRSMLNARPDDALVLAGHGAASSFGAERASNPFLAALQQLSKSSTEERSA